MSLSVHLSSFKTTAYGCINILPKFSLSHQESEENIAQKLIEGPKTSTIVSSIRLKEDRLFVFSCNHSLNQDEMLEKVTNIQEFLKKKGEEKTAKFIYGEYLKNRIPMQCPRCLLSSLQNKLK